MTKAEHIRQAFQILGHDASNKEIMAHLASTVKVTSGDISAIRNRNKKPTLTIESLRKIRSFIDQIGGVEILEEGLALIKEFQRQENGW